MDASTRCNVHKLHKANKMSRLAGLLDIDAGWRPPKYPWKENPSAYVRGARRRHRDVLQRLTRTREEKNKVKETDAEKEQVKDSDKKQVMVSHKDNEISNGKDDETEEGTSKSNVDYGSQSEEKEAHKAFPFESEHIHYDLRDGAPEVKTLEEILSQWKAEMGSAVEGRNTDGDKAGEERFDTDLVLEEMDREFQRQCERQEQALKLEHEQDTLQLEREFLSALLSTHEQERNLSIMERESMMRACKRVVQDAVTSTKIAARAEASAKMAVLNAESKQKLAEVKGKAELEKVQALKANWEAAQSTLEAELRRKSSSMPDANEIQHKHELTIARLEAKHA